MSSGKKETNWWAIAAVGIGASIVGFLAGMTAAKEEDVIKDPAAVRKPLNPAVCERANDGDPTCVVCMENRVDCVLGPCNHVLCQACAERVERCPTCREQVTTKERLFL